MIIKYNGNDKLKAVVEEYIMSCQNFHHDLLVNDLYSFLKFTEEKLSIEIEIEPSVDINKKVEGGWKWTTLRYFAECNEYSCFLPNPETFEEKEKVDKKINNDDIILELESIDIKIRNLLNKLKGETQTWR